MPKRKKVVANRPVTTKIKIVRQGRVNIRGKWKPGFIIIEYQVTTSQSHTNTIDKKEGGIIERKEVARLV